MAYPLFDFVWLVVVSAFSLFLVGLGVVAIFVPTLANRFLLAFATSASKHYLELLVRTLVAIALLQLAPKMPFPTVFMGFAAVLLISSIGLLLVPWRWHHRFASAAVPKATRFIGLIGVSAFAAGAFLMWALARALSV